MSERSTIVAGVVIKFHEPFKKMSAADHNVAAYEQRDLCDLPNVVWKTL